MFSILDNVFWLGVKHDGKSGPWVIIIDLTSKRFNESVLVAPSRMPWTKASEWLRVPILWTYSEVYTRGLAEVVCGEWSTRNPFTDSSGINPVPCNPVSLDFPWIMRPSHWRVGIGIAKLPKRPIDQTSFLWAYGLIECTTWSFTVNCAIPMWGPNLHRNIFVANLRVILRTRAWRAVYVSREDTALRATWYQYHRYTKASTPTFHRRVWATRASDSEPHWPNHFHLMFWV